MQIGSSILFVVGSVLFLPGLGTTLYTTGCWLFVLASLILMVLSTVDLLEARRLRQRPLQLMAAAYLIGLTFFLIGTIGFFPRVTNALGGTTFGVVLFVIGSFSLIGVCLANVAHIGWSEHRKMVEHRKESANWKRTSEVAVALAVLHTNVTMLGLALLLVGSVLYLPTFECDSTRTLVVATWMYVTGSLLLLLGAAVKLSSGTVISRLLARNVGGSDVLADEGGLASGRTSDDAVEAAGRRALLLAGVHASSSEGGATADALPAESGGCVAAISISAQATGACPDAKLCSFKGCESGLCRGSAEGDAVRSTEQRLSAGAGAPAVVIAAHDSYEGTRSTETDPQRLPLSPHQRSHQQQATSQKI